jgi:hypothetical protein
MTLNSSNEELERILQLLSDPAALQERGADALWVERCARLVEEFRTLRKRVAELEAKLSALEHGSQQDTAIL